MSTIQVNISQYLRMHFKLHFYISTKSYGHFSFKKKKKEIWMDTSFVSYTGVPILPYVIVALNVQMSEPLSSNILHADVKI